MHFHLFSGTSCICDCTEWNSTEAAKLCTQNWETGSNHIFGKISSRRVMSRCRNAIDFFFASAITPHLGNPALDISFSFLFSHVLFPTFSLARENWASISGNRTRHTFRTLSWLPFSSQQKVCFFRKKREVKNSSYPTI